MQRGIVAMRLEGLTITLRERSPWEAVDLGVALVRQHAKSLLPAWAVATALALLLFSALGEALGSDWLAGMLLWWLKPLFDCLPLYALSQAVLGRCPGVAEILRRGWGFGGRRILPWLLWRRLHPARSMLLPVDLLEQPRGAARRARIKVLGGSGGAPQVLLTVIGAHLELMLWLSILMFGLMFVPVEYLPDSTRVLLDAWSEDPPWWLAMLNNAIYWLVLLVLEPVYVGAGFALYLNRRTELEAWDIELAFRRLAARLAQASAAAVFALALLLHGPIAAAQDDPTGDAVEAVEAVEADAEAEAEADEHETPHPGLQAFVGEAGAEPRRRFDAAVERAFADPDLSPTETRWEWVERERGEQESADAAAPAWLELLVVIGSALFEYAGWIALAIGAVLLLVHRRRWLGWVRPPQSATAPSAEVRELIEPPSLPADVAAAAAALWQAGQGRAALALLYRASVQRLVHTLDRPLPPGATEAECLRLARGLADAGLREHFVLVVRHWQAAAYAHRLPADSEFAALLAQWRAPEPRP